MRRGTLSKAKSRARTDPARIEEGVNGRNITVVREGGRVPRITNDGILLDGNEQIQSQAIEDDDEYDTPTKPVANSDESDTTTFTAARTNSMELGPLDNPEHIYDEKKTNSQTDPEMRDRTQAAPTGITFADTVKRSDGQDDETKFPQKRTNAEHIAILERQRNQDTDTEVLRIPGPRDAERGMIPRRLSDSDSHEDDALTVSQTRDSRPDQGNPNLGRPYERRPTIVIAEPERPTRKQHGLEEVVEDTGATGSAFESLRFRRPRMFSSGEKTGHEEHHHENHQDNHDAKSARALSMRTFHSIRTALSRDKVEDMPYLSYTPTIARNSNFVGLTLEQREELGGIEYRSLRTLVLILVGYFVGFQALAVAFMLPFIKHNHHYGEIVEDAGVTRTWWAFFTSNSAMMDLGFTLTPDSMNSFNTSEYTMMILWFFIIIGNTGFPVMLRFIIWVMAKITPRGTGLWEELRFLLDHPRRCFTLLFPSGANWWLFWILVALNAVDLLFFIVLDLNTGPVAQLPVHTRIADGLFQAAATRTAGFSCFSMSDLHPAMPVLYMIMMYISVFPIAISIRRTNVYEEKSLGVYHDKKDEDEAEDGPAEASALSYVGTHLRRQLSFDLWYVFVGFFLLSISEGSKVQAGRFNLFDILFEVVSAYGTVGLSMGVPGVDASLCSQFSVVGKLIICAMQIRGRHRGLPYGLDRAVLLPSESRFKRETEDQPVLIRTRTNMSTGASGVERGRRGSRSSIRGRSTSRGRERTNSHLITSFLHPGPVIPHEAMHGHNRTKSSDTRSLRRYNTEPVPEDEEEQDNLSPLRNIKSNNPPRRAETAPMS